MSELEVRWLVSAKHYSHSGRSVRTGDELDILGRTREFDVDGFMAFYSTAPASSLADRFRRIEKEAEVYVYDRGRIGNMLLSDPALDHVFKHYFPKSHKSVYEEAKKPGLRLFTEIGSTFPKDRKIAIELPSALESAEGDGSHVRVVDSEMEDLMIAWFIARSLRDSEFKILYRFISFRPTVWRHLQVLLEDGRIDGEALSREIRETAKSTYLRLLIIVAGAAQVSRAAESICKKFLFEGRRHHSKIKLEPMPITPFFDTVKKSLSQLPDSVAPIVQDHLSLAKSSKRWQEKRLFESVLKKMKRRRRLGAR